MLPLKATFILIALIKTPGEGGTIQLPFETEAACVATGQMIEAEFEEMISGNNVHPRVLWSCIAPAQD